LKIHIFWKSTKLEFIWHLHSILKFWSKLFVFHSTELELSKTVLVKQSRWVLIGKELFRKSTKFELIRISRLMSSIMKIHRLALFSKMNFENSYTFHKWSYPWNQACRYKSQQIIVRIICRNSLASLDDNESFLSLLSKIFSHHGSLKVQHLNFVPRLQVYDDGIFGWTYIRNRGANSSK